MDDVRGVRSARSRRASRVLAATCAVGAVGAMTACAPGSSAPSASSSGAACGIVFDDFSYATLAELEANGWTVRTGAGHPGLPGASWGAEGLSFATSDDATGMRLTSSTDGTAAGPHQVEVSLADLRFLSGTYLARIRFADGPIEGPDVDVVNQTFYTISPLAASMDPSYSELDVTEYLPNGGWGYDGPTDFFTSWHTYRIDPWMADNDSDVREGSLAGWHTVMATVADGHVRYYVDGELVGDHSGDVYPRQAMSINVSQWFIELGPHDGGAVSTWVQDVDYVVHAAGEVLSATQVEDRVAEFRAAGRSHIDTVPAVGRSACAVP